MAAGGTNVQATIKKYRCPKCGKLNLVRYSGPELFLIVFLYLLIIPGIIANICIWTKKMHCKNCGTKLHLVDEVDQEEILEHMKNQREVDKNIYDENEQLKRELANLKNQKSDKKVRAENAKLKKEIAELKKKKV